MTIQKWLQNNTTSLQGKRIAVTGSTGGLGVHLCAYLASLGADLVLLDRSKERSAAHQKSLTDRFKNINVSCVHLDLEDLTSAQKAVERLGEIGIDIFIHNAGAYSIPRHHCQSGYDNIFQINFATPYYMINQLLPMLQVRKGKVVAVGSIAHNYSKIDVKDVDFTTRKACSKVYGNAKRYLMFALFELFQKETQVDLSIVHPGITFTGITNHYPKLIFALIKHPMKVIFMKPKKAALSILKGVFESTPYCHWIGPRYFDIWGLPRQKKLTTCPLKERQEVCRLAEKVLSQCHKVLEK